MLHNGVPMPWMGDWGASHPILVREAPGNRVTGLDGNAHTHVYLANRGLLITPFHNMMRVLPVATDVDIDRRIQGWDDGLAEIAACGREAQKGGGSSNKKAATDNLDNFDPPL